MPVPPLRLFPHRDPPGHPGLLRGLPHPGRRRTPPVRHPGPVLHHPPGAGHPAAHAGLRLLHAGEGVRLRQRLQPGGPLRGLPAGQVPRGRILPAQQQLQPQWRVLWHCVWK